MCGDKPVMLGDEPFWIVFALGVFAAAASLQRDLSAEDPFAQESRVCHRLLSTAKPEV